MSVNEFSVDSARASADAGTLDEWVARFLASPGSDNAVLAAALSASNGWWVGPIELPLDRLHRLAGPEGAPVVEVVDEDEWRDDVGDLADDVAKGLELPPIIVTYRNDQLVVEDGNHRLEAARRAGREQAWSIVGFEREDDLERFAAAYHAAP